MDILRSLIDLKDLKMPQKPSCLHLFYDKQFDCLQIMFVSPETDTAVHYVDKNVALIFNIESKEVVGIQVEDFEKVFLPVHAALNRAWRLSNIIGSKQIQDFGEIAIVFEEAKPIIAREVIKASELVAPAFGKKWQELEQLAFATA